MKKSAQFFLTVIDTSKNDVVDIYYILLLGWRSRSWFFTLRIELRYGYASAVFGCVKQLLSGFFIYLNFDGFSAIGDRDLIEEESDGFLFGESCVGFEVVRQGCGCVRQLDASGTYFYL